MKYRITITTDSHACRDVVMASLASHQRNIASCSDMDYDCETIDDTRPNAYRDHLCHDETATIVNGGWVCNCPRPLAEQSDLRRTTPALARRQAD